LVAGVENQEEGAVVELRAGSGLSSKLTLQMQHKLWERKPEEGRCTVWVLPPLGGCRKLHAACSKLLY